MQLSENQKLAIAGKLTYAQACYFDLQDSRRKIQVSDPDRTHHVITQDRFVCSAPPRKWGLSTKEQCYEWAVKFCDAVFRFTTESAARDAAERLAKERSKPYPRPPKTWFTKSQIDKPVGITQYSAPPCWIENFPGCVWAGLERKVYSRYYGPSKSNTDYGYHPVYTTVASAFDFGCESETVFVTEEVRNELHDKVLLSESATRFWGGDILDYALSGGHIHAVALECWRGEDSIWRCCSSSLPTSLRDAWQETENLTWVKAKGQSEYTGRWPDGTVFRVAKYGSRWTLQIPDRYVALDKKARQTRAGAFYAARQEWCRKVHEDYRARVC